MCRLVLFLKILCSRSHLSSFSPPLLCVLLRCNSTSGNRFFFRQLVSAHAAAFPRGNAFFALKHCRKTAGAVVPNSLCNLQNAQIRCEKQLFRMLHTAAAQVSIDWQAVHLFECPFQRSKRDMIPLRPVPPGLRGYRDVPPDTGAPAAHTRPVLCTDRPKLWTWFPIHSLSGCGSFSSTSVSAKSAPKCSL